MWKIYVYMGTYTCVSVYVYVCVRASLCVYVPVYVCMSVCVFDESRRGPIRGEEEA